MNANPDIVSPESFPIGSDGWRAIAESLNLTDRELQIIQALFDGRREEAIAQALGISRFTVHTHLGRVYRKLQVDSCSALLLRVFREHLTEAGTAACRSPNPATPFGVTS